MKSEILPYPEVKSLNKECKKLVVFLHGLGSDGNDLIGLVPFLASELPNCHFISPHGVEAYDRIPTAGRQWFSVNSPTEADLNKNVNLLESIIQKKQAELNVINKDTIIIGFSQGTMVGLYLNFMQKDPFYAVIGFSGRLIPVSKCINTTTPICLIHGELDEVIEISYMTEIIEYLEKHNITYTSHKIPNLMHSIDSRGLNFALKFINNLNSI